MAAGTPSGRAGRLPGRLRGACRAGARAAADADGPARLLRPRRRSHAPAVPAADGWKASCARTGPTRRRRWGAHTRAAAQPGRSSSCHSDPHGRPPSSPASRLPQRLRGEQGGRPQRAGWPSQSGALLPPKCPPSQAGTWRDKAGAAMGGGGILLCLAGSLDPRRFYSGLPDTLGKVASTWRQGSPEKVADRGAPQPAAAPCN